MLWSHAGQAAGQHPQRVRVAFTAALGDNGDKITSSRTSQHEVGAVETEPAIGGPLSMNSDKSSLVRLRFF